MRRMLIRRMCNMKCKQALILLGCGFVGTIFLTYFVLSNHGDSDDILASNKRSNGDTSRFFGNKNTDDMDETEMEVHEEEKQAIEYWETFIKKNNYISIGEVYDNCDENDRMMVGRTVMLPNNKFLSKIKARTFINVTLESEVTGGKFYLDVQYKGRHIFKREWELCTLDEDAEDRVVFCPFDPADYSVVKDRDIPSLLPWGQYITKGEIKDQNGETILCGFSDFTI